jgi:hypothetical protein
MFNSPNDVPKKTLKDLHTIVGDNKNRAAGLPHIRS